MNLAKERYELSLKQIAEARRLGLNDAMSGSEVGDISAYVEILRRDANDMLQSLRVAVLALAHASREDRTYEYSYRHVNDTIARCAERYDHER